MSQSLHVPMLGALHIQGKVAAIFDASCAGVIRFLFLIGHLRSISVWLGEHRRTNTMKTRGYKRLDCVVQF